MPLEEVIIYTLITGTTSGIGKELARLFAADGHDLITVARSEDILRQQKQELEKEFGISVRYIVKDLSVSGSAQEVYDEIKESDLAVDILVNNAGFGELGSYIDIDWQRHEKLVNVNMLSLMHLSYLFGQDMAKNGGGRIVNVSSTASFQAGPYMAAYYASKAFVRSFSEALHEEMKRFGVIVTAICPGPTATNFEENSHMQGSAIFTRLKVDTAKVVATKSYRAILKNKAVYVVGVHNKVLAFLTRFLSLRINRKIAMRFNLGSSSVDKTRR